MRSFELKSILTALAAVAFSTAWVSLSSEHGLGHGPLEERNPDASASTCAERAKVFRAAYAQVVSGPGAAAFKMAKLVENAISLSRIPGASVLVGTPTGTRVKYHRGTLSKDSQTSVTSETLYDLASLTKVVATAPAILLLAEQQRLSISASVESALPEFSGSEIGKIKIENLLRHRGGLRDISLPQLPSPTPSGSPYPEQLKAAYFEKLARLGMNPDPTQRDAFLYADSNYLLLGRIVERVSGMPLDQFAKDFIFLPLGMTHTAFKPRENFPSVSCARAIRDCEVQDPTAFAFGGVAGNAGVFSTAEDLALYLRMLLNRGTHAVGTRSFRFLSEESVLKMTTDPEHPSNQRGLGFDINTDYSCAPRGELSLNSFGHTGYTGTSLWVDRDRGLFVITLTNEVDIAKGPAEAIRWNLATLIKGM